MGYRERGRSANTSWIPPVADICAKGRSPSRRLLKGWLADEVLSFAVEVASVKATLLCWLARGVAGTLLRFSSFALIGLIRTEPFISWVAGG